MITIKTGLNPAQLKRVRALFREPIATLPIRLRGEHDRDVLRELVWRFDTGHKPAYAEETRQRLLDIERARIAKLEK